MSYRSSSQAKVYVGDLGSDACKEDLESAFSRYGRIQNVWLAQNPPGFGFVEFEDERDAEDSIKELDGTEIAGCRVRVEMARGRRGGGGGRGGGYRRGGGGGGGYGGRSGGGGGYGGRGGGDSSCYECGERGHFARDCNNRRSGGGGGGGRYRRYDRSRSRSRD